MLCRTASVVLRLFWSTMLKKLKNTNSGRIKKNNKLKNLKQKLFIGICLNKITSTNLLALNQLISIISQFNHD